MKKEAPRFLDAADTRAKRRQLADDVLVAALDIVRVLDGGRAVGSQRRDDHGRARAQIARTHLTAVELADAVDDGGLASTWMLRPMRLSSPV